MHQHVRKPVEHVIKAPFGDIAKGPLQIFISIDRQRLHLYSGGVHVADAPVATGVPGHLTPRGVFSIIGRDRYHHSNIYSNAPMPYMQRITWSGVALHEGPGVGHEASHGCIRMPHNFAARLWLLHTMGARVIIAQRDLRPIPFADSHLFLHKDKPAAPTAASYRAVETAQAVAPGMKTDAGNPTAASVSAAQPSSTSTISMPSDPGGPTQAPPAKAAASAVVAPVDAAVTDVPLPPFKPAKLIELNRARPISIFISRKNRKIYVRQSFIPLFEAPVTIDKPNEPLGTHVFTAIDFLPDGSALRWNVVSLPSEPAKAVRTWKREWRYVTDFWGRRWREAVKVPIVSVQPAEPSETPQEALARIEIPQNVIDQISQSIVPGSSLIVSDRDLGPETGSGTDFIVITH